MQMLDAKTITLQKTRPRNATARAAACSAARRTSPVAGGRSGDEALDDGDADTVRRTPRRRERQTGEEPERRSAPGMWL